MNRRFIGLSIASFILLAIGVSLLWWGLYGHSYFKIITGIVIIFFIITNGIGRYFALIQLQQWFDDNRGKLILFYATKKPVQENIKYSFIPLIPFDVMEVYYDKSKLVGDVKWWIVRELMTWNKNIKVNQPCVIRIMDNDIKVRRLKELMRLDLEKSDYEELVAVVKEFKERVL
jgi:hypothetical protein